MLLQARAHLVSLAPPRDAGHEGLDPQLSGEEGGGLRAGEERPAERPAEPRLYPCAPTGSSTSTGFRGLSAANQNQVGSVLMLNGDLYVMSLKELKARNPSVDVPVQPS